MTFDELQLIEPLLRAVRAEGYNEPTLIQSQAIPHILAGRDVLGCAQTGTGKTAAFALPILQHLVNNPTTGPYYIRALVLSPTRELAAQIGESFRTYGRYTRIHQTTVFGGVSQVPQIDRLRRGPDVLVATPGRLLDLMNQGYVKLNHVEILVLDESDQMLDMGFIQDVRRIIAALPVDRQTLMFSATMPTNIKELAENVLRDPVPVAVTPVASTVETIDQLVYFVERGDKPMLLEQLLRDPSIKRALVFTRTKHDANRVSERLQNASIYAEAIHSNKSQAARAKALADFRAGKIRVLVATDIAARGLDIDNVSHVINYNLPNEPDSYVHRIGRTGRAGAAGIAFSFCELNERGCLVDIERLIRMHIPRVTDHMYATTASLPPMTELDPRRRHNNGPKPNNQSRRPGQNGPRPQSSRPYGPARRGKAARDGSRRPQPEGVR